MAASFWVVCNGKRSQKCRPEEGILLHTAGLDVQDIYFTFEEEGGSDNYRKVTATLNKYFKPQATVPYERLCFRETSQLVNETVEQSVTRLRQTARTCEFGDANAVEEQIRDQVINKCLSHELRRKLLQKGVLDKFPGCCEGIGKLKDFQLKIPIDPEMQAVAQPIRRVP